MPLLIATSNPGKLREFGALIPDLALIAPRDLGLDLEVEENGRSFAENAALKARAFSAAAGLIAVADDSGLEVDALDGAPGVLSARFGGPDLDDGGRCRLLLARLRGLPRHRRRARFRCCIAVIAPDGRGCRSEGACEGIIAPAPAGGGGFGYDPVFFLPTHGRTMAEVSPDVKNGISHRARALQALQPLLLQTFPELAVPS